jgi:hypothetical protein
MKVRITNQKMTHSDGHKVRVWFSNHIGEIFEVKKTKFSTYRNYYIVTQKYAADGTSVKGKGIDLDYAEVVMEDFEPKSGMIFKTEQGDVGFFIDNPSGVMMAFFVGESGL